MLMRLWIKGNTPPLVMGMQTYTATMEINTVVHHKTGDQPTSRSSYSTILPQGTCLSMILASLFIIDRNRKQLSCLSTEEQIKGMWYIYTMGNYSAVINNDMKFLGK